MPNVHSHMLFGGSFSPKSIPSLAAWWDFADVASLWKDTARTSPVTADADIILGVTDKSGVANHLSVAVNGPAYKVNIQNGKSVARFDGVNDILSAADATSIELDTNSTVFVVYNPDSAGTFGLLTKGDGANPASYYLSTLSGAVELDRPFIEAGLFGANVGSTTTRILTTRVSSTSVSHYLEGADAGIDTLPVGTATNTVLYIGAIAPGSTHLDGDISEILIYNTALTDAQINAVGQYLATKWGKTWNTVVDPSTISGLVAWYDFAAPNLIWEDAARTNQAEANDVILAVTDRSGAGNHLSEATNGPQLKANIQNGRSVARFDGVNDQLTKAALTQAQPFTTFIAAKYVAETEEHILDSQPSRVLVGRTNADGFIMYAGTIISLSSSNTNPHVWVTQFNGASSKGGLDGGVLVTGNAGAASYSNDTLSVGGSGNPITAWVQADVYEILTYSGALSLANINTIGNYLAAKWGTTWTTAT